MQIVKNTTILFDPINYTILRSFSHNTTHVVCQIAILCYCLIVEFVVTLQS